MSHFLQLNDKMKRVVSQRETLTGSSCLGEKILKYFSLDCISCSVQSFERAEETSTESCWML